MSKNSHLMTGEDFTIWVQLNLHRKGYRTAHHKDGAVMDAWQTDRATDYSAVESAERDIAFFEMHE